MTLFFKVLRPSTGDEAATPQIMEAWFGLLLSDAKCEGLVTFAVLQFCYVLASL